MGGATAVLPESGVGASRPLRLTPVSPLPERLAVGGGTAVFLDGLCSHPDGAISSLRVSIDDVDHPVLAEGMPPPGVSDRWRAGRRTPGGDGDGYWWAIVPIPAVTRPRLARLRLRARTHAGAEAVGELGVIELHPTVDVGEAAPPARSRARDRRGDGEAGSGQDLIAVCMATYEPPLDLFRRQIDSIREQTHENWVCVISDDHSSPQRLEQMREAIGDDERFSLSPGAERLGFYGNFERALALAPEDAAYVAMCDQDDRWYPEKLDALAKKLGGATKLVYSDMRIVDRTGEIKFDTYWSYRRNNHTNFGSLLIANTVTGAASLFTREVLDYALPFPPRYGANYHDHWVAVVAMALGEIAYVDRPLYDYVQHEGAVLGHARANGLMRGRALRRDAREGGGGNSGVRAHLGSLRLPRGMRSMYFTHYCGTAITAQVAEMRCGPVMGKAKRRTLKWFADSVRATAWLAARSPRRWVGRTETLRREQALLGGLAWRRYAEVRKRLTALPLPGSGQNGRALSAPGARGGPAPAPAAAASADGASEGGPWLTPILVDYFTRDGSTLMMRLLATSPNIAVEDQYPYERKYFNYLWRWSRMLDRGQWPSESWSPSGLASITQERHIALLGPPPWSPRALIESAPGEEWMSSRLFELAWQEFSARAARATAGSTGDPGAVRFYAEKHLDTWLLDRGELPAYELLVLLRDPRDSYVSITAFNEKRGTAGFGRSRVASDREHLDQLIARQRERLRWIAGLLAQDDPSVVRYDELVLDMEAVARRLEARLGVSLHPQTAREDAQMRKAHVSASSPESSVGRWRSELDAETIEIFRSELGEELEAVGFEV